MTAPELDTVAAPIGAHTGCRTETFPAMGTTVAVTTDLPDGVDRTRAIFAEVETTCSRFDRDSELSRLNRGGPGTRLVSPLLAEALRTALDLRTRTAGLVDPCVGGDVIAWGYDRTFAEVGDRPAPDSPPPPADRDLVLDGCRLTLAGCPGLDLGGTAKGWTVDRVIERGLARVVNAGGDLRSTDPRTVVLVDDPWGSTVARLRVGIGALATSSTAFRRWSVGGRRVSHLIDPRTGRPTDSPIVSATALADTAAEADAAAKAVLLHGEQGLEWARTTPWVHGAMVVWADGSAYATADLGDRICPPDGGTT